MQQTSRNTQGRRHARTLAHFGTRVAFSAITNTHAEGLSVSEVGAVRAVVLVATAFR